MFISVQNGKFNNRQSEQKVNLAHVHILKCEYFLLCNHQGRVVRKPVNANPGLKVNQSINFSFIKRFSMPMYCAVSGYSNSKLKDNPYEQKTSPKNHKMEIKILAHPDLG